MHIESGETSRFYEYIYTIYNILERIDLSRETRYNLVICVSINLS